MDQRQQRDVTLTFHYFEIHKEAKVKVDDIHKLFINIASTLSEMLPDGPISGRSKALCFTHLEDACHRAIESIFMQYGIKQELND